MFYDKQQHFLHSSRQMQGSLTGSRRMKYNRNNILDCKKEWQARALFACNLPLQDRHFAHSKDFLQLVLIADAKRTYTEQTLHSQHNAATSPWLCMQCCMLVYQKVGSMPVLICKFTRNQQANVK